MMFYERSIDELIEEYKSELAQVPGFWSSALEHKGQSIIDRLSKLANAQDKINDFVYDCLFSLCKNPCTESDVHSFSVKVLVDNISNFAQEKKTQRMKSLCYKAVEESQWVIVDYLLKKGLDINAFVQEGEFELNMLHVASRYGRVDFIESLLKRGADINYQGYLNDTALFFACYHGHEAAALALLKHDIDTEVKNEHGYTAYTMCRDYINDDRVLRKETKERFVNLLNPETIDVVKQKIRSGEITSCDYFASDDRKEEKNNGDQREQARSEYLAELLRDNLQHTKLLESRVADLENRLRQSEALRMQDSRSAAVSEESTSFSNEVLQRSFEPQGDLKSKN